MHSNNDTLKIISSQTKSSINEISVVTPSMYAAIFSKFASAHNTVLGDDNELAKNLLISECAHLTNLQNQASKSAMQLSESTSKAISAIKEKDEKLLQNVLQETQKLRLEIEKLKESVYKDTLTNVQNRKWLNDNYLKDDAQNFKDSGTLAIVDLNYFKVINDTFGHIVGDKVLIYIASELKKTRYSVVRYGGDEFIIMFSKNISAQKAKEILNELREKILSKKLKAQEELFQASFSFGVSEYEASQNFSDIIEKADKNMYEDKMLIKQRVTGI
ncbi:MAG: GGDEF domain-containing protein [Sulfurimonas sp.]|uniref:GGDEF domain-containing protein n=1 Tax=Sulfurimonas sp. TaxID=2022749 RepID=UPI0025E24D3E|nr:GGDEF domain-containing protein [Sulfurimonas sp.]MCK9491086.1 GGDEF domain-containing protein [Sulfurimonas sp.]